MESRVEPDPLESAITPEILQALIDERYRLEARLRRSSPDFRRLETVCRMIALYPPGAQVPMALDPISSPEARGGAIRSVPNPNPELSPTNPSSGPLTPPDPPTGSRRASWTYTDSQSSRVPTAAAEHLKEYGRGLPAARFAGRSYPRGSWCGGKSLPPSYLLLSLRLLSSITNAARGTACASGRKRARCRKN
jgi:hypothetical protein